MATQDEKDKLHNLRGKNVSDTFVRLLQKSSEWEAAVTHRY